MEPGCLLLCGMDGLVKRVIVQPVGMVTLKYRISVSLGAALFLEVLMCFSGLVTQ